MANNRMYLVNTRTGEKTFIAKYYPSTGWYLTRGVDVISAAFDKADFGHLTHEQKAANNAHEGMGVPYPSAGGMWGAEWKLELEQEEQPS